MWTTYKVRFHKIRAVRVNCLVITVAIFSIFSFIKKIVIEQLLDKNGLEAQKQNHTDVRKMILLCKAKFTIGFSLWENQ